MSHGPKNDGGRIGPVDTVPPGPLVHWRVIPWQRRYYDLIHIEGSDPGAGGYVGCLASRGMLEAFFFFISRRRPTNLNRPRPPLALGASGRWARGAALAEPARGPPLVDPPQRVHNIRGRLRRDWPRLGGISKPELRATRSKRRTLRAHCGVPTAPATAVRPRAPPSRVTRLARRSTRLLLSCPPPARVQLPG